MGGADGQKMLPPCFLARQLAACSELQDFCCCWAATAAAACAPRHIRTSIPPYAIHAIRTPRPVILTQHSRRRVAYGAFALCSCYVVLLLLLATSLHSLQPRSCSLLTAEQFINKYRGKAQA
eukprot:scaffold17819_cov120-Isochrysis_galbana.AAC.8